MFCNIWRTEVKYCLLHSIEKEKLMAWLKKAIGVLNFTHGNFWKLPALGSTSTTAKLNLLWLQSTRSRTPSIEGHWFLIINIFFWSFPWNSQIPFGFIWSLHCLFLLFLLGQQFSWEKMPSHYCRVTFRSSDPSINSQWTSLHLKQWSYVSHIPWDLIAGRDVHTSPPQAKSLHREKAATLFITRAFLCIFVCILLRKKWKHCFNSPQCWVNKHSKIGWWIKFLSSVCLCVPSCTQAWKRHKTSFRHKNANLVRTVSLAKKCNTLPGACIQFWISN